jgi:hypothetical protein
MSLEEIFLQITTTDSTNGEAPAAPAAAAADTTEAS